MLQEMITSDVHTQEPESSHLFNEVVTSLVHRQGKLVLLVAVEMSPKSLEFQRFLGSSFVSVEICLQFLDPPLENTKICIK